MQTDMISHDDIRYNAAEQQFEAQVTLHSPKGLRIYACAVPADLSMPLSQAATALRHMAMARHTSSPGLYATRHSRASLPRRAPQRPSWRRKLLNALPKLRMQRAA